MCILGLRLVSGVHARPDDLLPPRHQLTVEKGAGGGVAVQHRGDKGQTAANPSVAESAFGIRSPDHGIVATISTTRWLVGPVPPTIGRPSQICAR